MAEQVNEMDDQGNDEVFTKNQPDIPFLYGEIVTGSGHVRGWSL